MAKSKSDDKKTVARKSTTAVVEVPDFTKSRVVKKQVSALTKLTDWQRKSADTNWVIGEYFESY